MVEVCVYVSLCNKVSCDINGVLLLLLSALYFFWICVLSPHVVHKGKHETSVGEAHLDDKMEFNRENHEIQEVIDQGPRRPKLDPIGLWGRPLDLLH